jgi:DNA mismatch repair protein MutS2
MTRRFGIDALASPAVEARDVETLEFPRLLDVLAGHARSELGKEIVWALHPTTDRGAIEHGLDVVEELMALASEAGRLPTSDVPRIAPAIAMAAPEGAALEATSLVEIRDVLSVAKAVRAHLRRDPIHFATLSALADTLPAAPELEAALARVLDERGQVREDASPALAAARAATRELRAELEARLLAMVRDPELGDTVGDRYVTLRNGRYVVPVKHSAAWTFPGVVQDRSASEETVFVEPLFAVEVNNRLILASKTEEIEERRVRTDLTRLVRQASEAVAELERGLARADAFAAAAEFAQAHGCTRPTFGDGVALREARHPLLVVSGRTVVAADVLLPADRRGLAITGPNAGGKTVALKTLGLSALMAQSGLFVFAAAGSSLPLFDTVLVDIGDEQSIERDLSTFTGHAENLARIAASARPGTLVLLDEPGAGTDPIEGAALAVGVLTDLLERGPLVVFTTHFPQVKTFALAQPALDVAAFDVDPATGAPRYVLAYHTVGQSLALPIARRHGIPERALAVAERTLSGEHQDLAHAIRRLEDSRRELDEARDAARAEQAGVAAARAEAAALVEDLRARQRRRWADDLDASRRFVEDVERRGHALLERLRQRPDAATLRSFSDEVRGEIRAHVDEVDEPPAGRPPVPGDTVEVAGSKIRGELIEIEGDRARIRRGGMRFEVPVKQLRLAADAAAQPRVVVRLAPNAQPTESQAEVNLIGLHVREAVDALASFLDRAARTGVPEIRVVHGIGSGALRRAVHQFLATSPYCQSYREADLGAGGSGVTIAELA